LRGRLFTLGQLFAAISLLWLFNGVATAAETRIETPRNDGGRAVLVFAGHPLKTMTETPFAVELFNAQGGPVREAKLKLSLTMPFMSMPPNHPEAVWSEGAYRGIAIFTMAGAWQVQVAIERPGASPERLIFDIEMVVMQ
jgi:hypothetical protein